MTTGVSGLKSQDNEYVSVTACHVVALLFLPSIMLITKVDSCDAYEYGSGEQPRYDLVDNEPESNAACELGDNCGGSVRDSGDDGEVNIRVGQY